MYDWKGRWIEQDDEVPQLRRHCIGCGAFLPKRPEEHVRMIPTNWYTTYDEQGEETGIVILSEEKEIEALWTCNKCQREHESGEMCL